MAWPLSCRFGRKLLDLGGHVRYAAEIVDLRTGLATPAKVLPRKDCKAPDADICKATDVEICTATIYEANFRYGRMARLVLADLCTRNTTRPRSSTSAPASPPQPKCYP